ncbi:sigma-70 family RNA polymerase sigma factor [Alkalihalobacterium bogoriense]|uniref:sigma-70 family RNA polymerase sigma factor n=1 Tax=Alkalihalobacterium bogoriense TaxID=246272 RepID=UPI0004787712|nr:sigma-70 family RNA polymerase sigma factor [Alkalihalobacterium bogoriense]
MEKYNLVLNAIKGDESAFELLIKQESSKLYRTAFLYVRNKEDALDVVQETVYKAYQSITRLRNPEYFSTWLIKILIRTAFRSLEDKKKWKLLDSETVAVLLEQRLPDRSEQLDLVDALSLLNEKYQTAIILFYFHDLSIHTIAEMMDKPEGTIKTYLRRAKMELKKILEGDYHYEQKMV